MHILPDWTKAAFHCPLIYPTTLGCQGQKLDNAPASGRIQTQGGKIGQFFLSVERESNVLVSALHWLRFPNIFYDAGTALGWTPNAAFSRFSLLIRRS